ncbi:MAG: tetratricopeptide repeat protein [Bacillota bacterium]|nr:tetratricopeptide repeat protein [Bacillota bacterium]
MENRNLVKHNYDHYDGHRYCNLDKRKYGNEEVDVCIVGIGLLEGFWHTNLVKLLNKNEAAIADWKTYLKHVPRDVETNYRLGLVYFKLEDYALSIEYLTETVTLDKRYGDAYYQRANAYS